MSHLSLKRGINDSLGKKAVKVTYVLSYATKIQDGRCSPFWNFVELYYIIPFFEDF